MPASNNTVNQILDIMERHLDKYFYKARSKRQFIADLSVDLAIEVRGNQSVVETMKALGAEAQVRLNETD